ncbi:MAG: endonuclease III [Actinobacteria bacterium]|nr:endonuclease III [Actinomycetota bacterium]
MSMRDTAKGYSRTIWARQSSTTGDYRGRVATKKRGTRAAKKRAKGSTSGPATTPNVVRAKRPTKAELPKHALAILRHLKKDYPVAVCELTHDSPFQLLAATILSAQCTDARVNMVTPHLFAAYPTAATLAVADVSHVEQIVRSTGFYASKAKNLIGMANAVMTRFGGEVPSEMEDLVTLPGVGRKTANVLRSAALGLPGLPVDTHVLRLSKRLGLTRDEDPVKVEMQLNALLPPLPMPTAKQAGSLGPISPARISSTGS